MPIIVFHRNRGHKTGDYMRLKHVIQDLIDNRVIMVDGYKSNDQHGTFCPLSQIMKKVNHPKMTKVSMLTIVILMLTQLITLKRMSHKLMSSS